MSRAIFVQDGGAVDYTPTADVTAGDVIVQGDLVAVAKLDIKAGKLGSLAVEGVFDFPKATGAGTALTVGTIVYWNSTTKVATGVPTGNKLLGKVVRAASDSDAKVRVRLSQ